MSPVPHNAMPLNEALAISLKRPPDSDFKEQPGRATYAERAAYWATQPDPSPATLKPCSICGAVKPLTAFRVRPDALKAAPSFGRFNLCRRCEMARAKERQQLKSDVGAGRISSAVLWRRFLGGIFEGTVYVARLQAWAHAYVECSDEERAAIETLVQAQTPRAETNDAIGRRRAEKSSANASYLEGVLRSLEPPRRRELQTALMLATAARAEHARKAGL